MVVVVVVVVIEWMDFVVCLMVVLSFLACDSVAMASVNGANTRDGHI